MEWFKDRNRRTGVIVTLLVHVLVLGLLSFIYLQPPFPPPPQIGVEVNLGNSLDGMSDIQPDESIEQAANPMQASDNSEKIATQSTEESVNIKKKVTENKIQNQEPIINKNFQFKKKTNQNGGNEGQTGKPGDQGKEGGNPNSNNYNGDGGNGTAGVSFNLSGRKAKSLSKPESVPNQEGRVVVKIWVDKTGKVTKATQEVPKSTTTNSLLVNKAITSAYSSKFDSNPDAPEEQTGFITYIYVL